MPVQASVNEHLSAEMTPVAGARLPFNGRRRRPISIVCLTTCLEVGGAEMMLYRLLSGMDRTRFLPQVISLREPGPLSEKFRTLGVPMRSLGMRPGRRIRCLSCGYPMAEGKPARCDPNVDVPCRPHRRVAAKLAGGIPLAWGIRQSNLSDQGNRRLTIHTMRICAQLSRWLPARIVCGSEASQRVHAALGYATEKMIVIPNGFDLRAFKPDSAARESVRAELQIPADALVIGLVGRFDPQKDHRNFVYAAALLHRSRPDVHFLLCGDDITWENARIERVD